MRESLTGDGRKNVPGPAGPDASVEAVLESLRQALDTMAAAHAAGRIALDAAKARLEAAPKTPAPEEAPHAPPEEPAEGPAPPRVVGLDRSRDRSGPLPSVPARIHERETTSTTGTEPGTPWLAPAPWQDPRRRRTADAAPTPDAPATPEAARPSLPTPAATSEGGRSLRQVFIGLQRRANELDRLETPEALQAHLWQIARSFGVRGMLLQEKGRALYAEDAFGFDNFEGDKRGRLRKVVVPYDPDGLFGATAQDRAPYSGPRPAKGLPVDLVLVMGKKAPDWCLVVPMPYRNRWGTFLYFDATGDGLDALLELEAVARLAVLQLRAARYRQHEPSERVRAFRAQTLRDRKRKQAVRRGTLAQDADAPSAGGDDSPDPLSKKRHGPSLATPVEESRFDADGNLVRPLDGNEILARIGDLPTMPHVAARLIGLLEDPETEIRQLQEILSTDQAISVRLLQIANSSLYGNMREASNISEAIVRLGFTAIRSWLLSTVTRKLFVGDGTDETRMRLWRQSVLCAMAAELLAARTGAMDPEIAFVGGLLQNIGQLVLARSHPDVFAEIDLRARAAQQPYVDLEQRILGFDHADVGGILLQRWGLGDTLVSVVSSHHRIGRIRDDDDRFAAIIALAEELASRLGGGPTEGREDEMAELEEARRLDVDAATLDAIAEQLASRAMDRELFSD